MSTPKPFCFNPWSRQWMRVEFVNDERIGGRLLDSDAYREWANVEGMRFDDLAADAFPILRAALNEGTTDHHDGDTARAEAHARYEDERGEDE